MEDVQTTEDTPTNAPNAPASAQGDGDQGCSSPNSGTAAPAASDEKSDR